MHELVRETLEILLIDGDHLSYVEEEHLELLPLLLGSKAAMPGVLDESSDWLLPTNLPITASRSLHLHEQRLHLIVELALGRTESNT